MGIGAGKGCIVGAGFGCGVGTGVGAAEGSSVVDVSAGVGAAVGGQSAEPELPMNMPWASAASIVSS